MTHDELEQALRDSLEARAAVRDEDIRPLRGYVKALPPRRKRRGGAVLAAAAGIVVMLGIGGLLVVNLPPGLGGAAPDSRLAVCGVTADDAEAIFQMDYVRDYPLHLPAARPPVGLAADPEAPALVIVLKGPASGDRAGNSPRPGNHDLCMVVGTGEQPWRRVDLVDVDTTGLIAVLPAGTPFADALAPWAERCGGADARIVNVYTFDRGTDIATSLALDPSPPELDTDEPGAVIVYVDGHPFPPFGTPPPGGATIAPRDSLAPDHHDLCVLVGADPATATRTIHEDVGVASAVTSPPGPDATPLPRTFPLAVADGCDTIGVDNPVTGKLRGDPSDPDLVWLEAPGGRRLTIVWPAGFAVAFEPRLRLVAGDGSLVANAGDTIFLQVPRAAAAGTRADPYVADGILLAGPDIAQDLNAATFQGCFHKDDGSASPPVSPSAVQIPPAIDPTDCRTMRFTDARCLAVVEQALRDAGLAWADVERVSVARPAPPNGASLGGRFGVAAVTFSLADGRLVEHDVQCGLGGQYSLVCSDNPEIKLISGVDRDVPCGAIPGGDPGSACATPLPDIKPSAAKRASPLEIDSRDIPITSAGQVELNMGRATIPNGVLSEATFTLADVHTRAFRVEDGIRLEVRPLDPSRPPFRNIYEHGWYPGTEEVEVYLVLDVASFTPGALLEIRNLVVR